YRELGPRVNRLAHHLRGLGVGPDVAVAVGLERTPDMLVTVLAVLAAGGAYVPVDPRHPASRVAHVLAYSGARVLVTLTFLLPALPAAGATIVCLDRDGAR